MGPDAHDGTTLVTKPHPPGSTDGYVHTNLTNGVTYYYRAFPCDEAPNYNTSASVTASTVPDIRLLWMNETFDPYSEGNLPGQGNWTLQTNNAQVQSAFAKGGSGRAVLLDSVPVGGA